MPSWLKARMGRTLILTMTFRMLHVSRHCSRAEIEASRLNDGIVFDKRPKTETGECNQRDVCSLLQVNSINLNTSSCSSFEKEGREDKEQLKRDPTI